MEKSNAYFEFSHPRFCWISMFARSEHIQHYSKLRKNVRVSQSQNVPLSCLSRPLADRLAEAAYRDILGLSYMRAFPQLGVLPAVLRLTAPTAMPGLLGAVSLRKSHDIVILSFCNIVKGQAICNDSREQWTLQKSEMKSCFNRFGSTPLGLLHTIQVLKCFLFFLFFQKLFPLNHFFWCTFICTVL